MRAGNKSGEKKVKKVKENDRQNRSPRIKKYGRMSNVYHDVLEENIETLVFCFCFFGYSNIFTFED